MAHTLRHKQRQDKKTLKKSQRDERKARNESLRSDRKTTRQAIRMKKKEWKKTRKQVPFSEETPGPMKSYTKEEKKIDRKASRGAARSVRKEGREERRTTRKTERQSDRVERKALRGTQKTARVTQRNLRKKKVADLTQKKKNELNKTIKKPQPFIGPINKKTDNEKAVVKKDDTKKPTTKKVTNHGVTDKLGFRGKGGAFDVARKAHGGDGGVFTWRGKKYNTNLAKKDKKTKDSTNLTANSIDNPAPIVKKKGAEEGKYYKDDTNDYVYRFKDGKYVRVKSKGEKVHSGTPKVKDAVEGRYYQSKGINYQFKNGKYSPVSDADKKKHDAAVNKKKKKKNVVASSKSSKKNKTIHEQAIDISGVSGYHGKMKKGGIRKHETGGFLEPGIEILFE